MRKRETQAEQLDNLNLSGMTLERTLRELATINRWSGNYRCIRNGIRKFLHQHPGQSLTIVDLGCGGGDTLIMLAKWLDRQNIPTQLIGVDGNRHSLAYAKKQSTGLDHIRWLEADILNDEFLVPPCDLLISTHFLYHMEDQVLIEFLNRQHTNIRRGWVVSELTRAPFAILGFQLLSRIIGFSKMTREDGVLAVQRALTQKEWQSLLSASDHGKFQVTRTWIFRLQLLISY